MKQKFFLLLSVLMLGTTLYAHTGDKISDRTSLSGTIKDKKTGERLPGVNIYLPDLKVGAQSDNKGNYHIDNLPSAKVLVQVTFIGYSSITSNINLATASKYDFALEESVNELNEVVVTGLSKAQERNRTASPISVISAQELTEHSASNIIDAIAKQPGVSQISTGVGISKPVIRGLGFNRVVLLNDGIRQEGQQWGDEHGIEVDEFGVHSVEILKGPASLAYGSDALAGVINLLTAPTLPEGKIKANFLSNYQTNNGLIAYSANVAGTKKGVIWDLRYSNKNAHAYQNKYDGYVYNSGFSEQTMSAILGLNRSWGYTHLHLSSYRFKPGIVEGERDSTTGKFLKLINDQGQEGEAIATDQDLKAYASSNPYQEIKHDKVVLNNSFIVGDGSLKATIGFQQNQRQEFGDILNPNQYGLYFLLRSINYDLHYVLPEKKGWTLSVGTNGMQQSSQNKGTEFLVPAYNLFDIGVFAIVKKSLGKLDLSGGLRYDVRSQQGESLYLDANGVKTDVADPSATQQFAAFRSRFKGVSGSIGATYQFSEAVYAKLNIARGFRAPNIAEIGANGEHEGTIRYEIGDPTLKAEQSLQVDYALGLNNQHVSAELDVFVNTIDGFIFSRKLNTALGADSLMGGYSAFKFVSGKAQLFGGEVAVDVHPPSFRLVARGEYLFVCTRPANRAKRFYALPALYPGSKAIYRDKSEQAQMGQAFGQCLRVFRARQPLGTKAVLCGLWNRNSYACL